MNSANNHSIYIPLSRSRRRETWLDNIVMELPYYQIYKETTIDIYHAIIMTYENVMLC